MSDRARQALARKAERGQHCQCEECLLDEALAWADDTRSRERRRVKKDYDVVAFIRALDLRGRQ